MSPGGRSACGGQKNTVQYGDTIERIQDKYADGSVEKISFVTFRREID